MGAVLWLGPVTAANLAGALPAGWRLIVHNRGMGGGIGSSALALAPNDPFPLAFRDWAMTLGLDPLSELGVGPSEPCIMAGFSAAHGAHEPILARVALRRDMRLVGLFGFDAYYTSWIKTPKPGHLAWLSWVRDEPLGRGATFTTSSHAGADHPSATASFRPLANLLGMRPSAHMPPFGHRPERSHELGPLRWYEYGTTYKHVEHATVLARQFVHGALVPSGAPSSPPSSSTTGGALLILSVALLALRSGDS